MSGSSRCGYLRFKANSILDMDTMRHHNTSVTPFWDRIVEFFSSASIDNTAPVVNIPNLTQPIFLGLHGNLWSGDMSFSLREQTS